jgi:hypothetical protein
VRVLGCCPTCGSQLLGRSPCTNRDNQGIPCMGMTDTQVALKAASDAYARDEVSIVELESRVEQALTNPPRRRFGSITVFR